MTTMRHEGYEAVVEYDDEAAIFHGEVVNLRDVVTFQGASVDELKAAFEASVADYLAFCRERGEDPDKPFSGRFVVRATPSLHKKISNAAREEGVSLNKWVTRKLEQSVG